jgi:putative flippase GtrA
MMKKISELWNKHKELLLYVLFGGLTTLVNFVTFWLCSLVLGEDLYLISNAIAWIVSVLFAYFTNKLFVFESRGGAWVQEGLKFFGARIFSGLLEIFLPTALFALGLKMPLLTVEGGVAKALVSVLIIVLNYVTSKLFVFRK